MKKFTWGRALANTFDYTSTANKTKWLKLRDFVLTLDVRPRFRSKILETGYVSKWDGEWYYHLIGESAINEGNFKEIEWFELAGSALEDHTIIERISSIGFCGEFVDGNLRLYGYIKNGEFVPKL